nr:MAG TPA: hypothetical protein [Caudoviricetes sp.]
MVPFAFTLMLFWFAPSRPPYEKFKSIGGRQPSGRMPKSPLPHEPGTEAFQSMRNVTSDPRR